MIIGDNREKIIVGGTDQWKNTWSAPGYCSTPRVECDGKPLNIRLKKAQALLFYLLVQKKATREEAAGLL